MSSPTPTELDSAADTSVDTPEAPPTARWWTRLDPVDLGFCLFYLFLAFWLTSELWPDPNSRVLSLNPADQTLYEWFLAYDTRIAGGDVGLITERLNAPSGVSLIANTSVILLGVLMTPVTLLFGVPVTFAVLIALNLAGTALAWHVLFRRVLHASPLAAGIGALLTAFSPAMVSQSVSHLHMTAQMLVPVMLWLVARMYRAAGERAWRRIVTSGLGLAAAVVTQVFIGEEVLFLTAVTLTLFAVGWVVLHPRSVWRIAVPFLAGMAVTGVVAGVLLAYPLWVQFAGPKKVTGQLFPPDFYVVDLASFTAFSPLSIAGGPETERLAVGPSEYNTFLGWPLLLLAAGLLVWLWRDRVVLAAMFAAVVMSALSLGSTVKLNGEEIDVPSLFALMEGLPVVDAAVPMRFALPLVPVIALMIVRATLRGAGSRQPLLRYVVPVLAVVAILPLTPRPLPAMDREPLPLFIADGHWRECVPEGGVLVPLPLPTPPEPWTMRWGAAVNADFGMPEGFFVGPYGPEGRAALGTWKRSFSAITDEVSKTGALPAIDDQKRSDTLKDLDFWNASCVAVADSAPNAPALRATVEALIGTPGTRSADVVYWRV